jgi:hypothetical protein
VKKNKRVVPALQSSQHPLSVAIIVKETRMEVIGISKQKDGKSKLKLKVYEKPVSREERKLFRKLDRAPPGSVMYAQFGFRPVPYFFQSPRAKNGRPVSMGQMLQDRALAVAVLDNQLAMALRHPHLFSTAGRALVHKVRNLAKILGMEERFEKAVNWELTREPQRHEQTRTTTRTESAAKPNKKKRRG